MGQNLINSGIINPQALPKKELIRQVAKYLGVAPNRIEKLELWKNQIWVNISGVGGKFISYRCLDVWIDGAIAAVAACQNRDELDYLGSIFRTEVEKYSHQYDKVALDKLRKAWGAKAKYITQEEKRLQPLREHQQAGKKWQEGWQQVLINCDSFSALQSLATEIERQSRKYDDLPEISQGMARIWQQRWQELSMNSA